MTKQSLALVPTSIAETKQLATTYSKSSLLPQDLRGKEADVFVTIMAGMELGLAPMAALRSIHVVKGKPVLSADGMVAVVHASGLCEHFSCVESSASIATYETKRTGTPTPQRLSFTIEEAKAAGLNGDNWRKYPAAMLRARAKAALARDVYPDAIAGCYTDDEAREFAPPVRVEQSPAAEFTAPPANDVIDAEVVETSLSKAEIAALILAAESVADCDRVALEVSVDAKKLPKDDSDELRALIRSHKANLAGAEGAA